MVTVAQVVELVDGVLDAAAGAEQDMAQGDAIGGMVA